MRLIARLLRLIWGADVDAALRPLLAVSFVGSAAFSAGWTFVGIWAIEELGASSQQLAVAYLLAAVAGFAAVALVAAVTGLAAVRGASRWRVTPVAAGY